MRVITKSQESVVVAMSQATAVLLLYFTVMNLLVQETYTLPLEVQEI